MALLISTVLQLSHMPQVGYAVVASDAVDMVDLLLRPQSVVMKPSDLMSFVGDAKQRTRLVPVAMVATDCWFVSVSGIPPLHLSFAAEPLP